MKAETVDVEITQRDERRRIGARDTGIARIFLEQTCSSGGRARLHGLRRSDDDGGSC